MGWFFLPRLVAAAMMIATLVLLTRLLGAAQFARYNIAITIGAVAYSLLFGWLSASMQRFHKAPEFNNQATAVVLGTGLRIAVFGLAVILLFGLFFPEMSDKFLLLAAIYFIAHSLHEMGLSGLRVLRDGPGFAAAVVLRPMIAVALMLSVYLVFDAKYEGMLISISVSAAAIGLLSLWATVKRAGIEKPRRDFTRQFFFFGAPLAFVSSATMIMSLVAQFSIAKFVDLTAVGVYAAAHTLAMRTINMPMVMLGRSMSATLYQSFEENGSGPAMEQMARYSAFLLLVSVPVATVLVFANDTVAVVLFGNALNQGVAPHLPLLAMAAFISGLQGAFFSYSFTISRRTGVQAMIITGTTLLHAALVILFVVLFGPIGASFAILTSSIAGLAAFVALGRRYQKVPIPFGHARRLFPAMVALALAATAADNTQSVSISLVLIGLGLLLFLILLYIQKYWAIRSLAERIFRRFETTRFAE